MPKKTAVPPRKKTLAWSLVNTAAKEFRLEMQNQSSVFAIKAFRTSGNKIEGRVDRGICCADIGKAEKHSLSAVTAGASEHRVTMLKIGKLAQQAISAASYLAEKYDAEGTRVSASEIADVRELPRPLVAKVLAQLSLHGITSGITGPTGGYRLARPPHQISLHDIVSIFEPIDIRPMCPFGPNWCGNGPPCPMHDAISAAAEQVDSFLQKQHLGPFCGLKSRSR